MLPERERERERGMPSSVYPLGFDGWASGLGFGLVVCRLLCVNRIWASPGEKGGRVEQPSAPGL